VGLYAVIDALGHLDQFAAHAQEKETNVLAAVARFYTFQSFGFFDRTSGILAMMAAMFTMAWFKRNNELTAMMAAGVSQLRAAMPLLVAAGVISILAAASREIVLPTIRSELLKSTKDLAGTTKRPLRPWYDPTTGVVLRGESTVAAGRRIVRPVVVLPSGIDAALDQITAREARYLEATGEHPAGYLLMHVDAEISQTRSISHGGHQIVYLPSDTTWLKEGQAFWPSDAEFDQLASGPTWRHFASTAELVDYVQHPSSDGSIAAAYVTLHGRFVRPILDMSLVVIGLPLVLSRRGRSPFLAVGVAMGLVAAFLLVALVCEFLGNSGWISPSLAAWLPLFLFVPLAVATSDVLRR
jgi:lipopolysaccharide export system permease protein